MSKKMSLFLVFQIFSGGSLFWIRKMSRKRVPFQVPFGSSEKMYEKRGNNGSIVCESRCCHVFLKKKAQKIGVAKWAKSRVNGEIQKFCESHYCRGFSRNFWYSIFGPKNEAETIDFLGWEKWAKKCLSSSCFKFFQGVPFFGSEKWAEKGSLFRYLLDHRKKCTKNVETMALSYANHGVATFF